MASSVEALAEAFEGTLRELRRLRRHLKGLRSLSQRTFKFNFSSSPLRYLPEEYENRAMVKKGMDACLSRLSESSDSAQTFSKHHRCWGVAQSPVVHAAFKTGFDTIRAGDDRQLDSRQACKRGAPSPRTLCSMKVFGRGSRMEWFSTKLTLLAEIPL